MNHASFVQLRNGFIAGGILMLSEPFGFSDVTAVTLARSDQLERGPTVAEIKHSGFRSLSTVVTFRCTQVS